MTRFWIIILANLVFLVIGYLIGSISPAIILSKIKKKVDIRSIGTKNPGATNVYTMLGKKLGFIVMWLDAGKTVFAAAIGYALFTSVDFFHDRYIYIHIAAVGSIIGHIFPIYYRFKGGKGVACILGYFITSMWPIAPLAIALIIYFGVKRKKPVLFSFSVITATAMVYLSIELLLGMTNNQQQWLTPLTYIPKMNIYPWWVNWVFMIGMSLISSSALFIKTYLEKYKKFDMNDIVAFVHIIKNYVKENKQKTNNVNNENK